MKIRTTQELNAPTKQVGVPLSIAFSIPCAVHVQHVRDRPSVDSQVTADDRCVIRSIDTIQVS